MNITYQLFEDENLFIQKYSGIFLIEEFKKYSRFMSQNFGSKAVKKILIDFRDLKFSDVIDEIPHDYVNNLEKLTEFKKDINKNELKDKDVVLAIWADQPVPALIAFQFIKNFSEMNYHFCDTAEQVIEILALPEHLHDMENLTQHLENTYQ
jgi:hypothetical protein